MKDIIVIAEYCSSFDSKNNGRFKELCDRLCFKNKVEIITSTFSHVTKKQKEVIEYNLNYKITNLYEPGYSKNVCFKRFYSHFIWGKNVKKYLNKRKRPDIIYCAVPSLTAAHNAAKYCKKNNIKFIIDVQDLWPEAFQMVFNVPVLSDLIFFPMKKQADYIYKNADKIVAVSETYRNRALQVNKKDKNGLVVYLGTNLSSLEEKLNDQKITYQKEKNEFWIGYLGTIGSSYDIKTALLATKEVQKEYSNVKLILLGDGPLLAKYKQMANDLNVNAVFLGRKDYIEAMKILSQCDIALNPLVKGAAQSIINKVGDYAALGLPIINSLENREYQELLNTYNAGKNVECENAHLMSKSIIELLHDKNRRLEMGNNNRKLAKEKFNRENTYKAIIHYILDESAGKNNENR